MPYQIISSVSLDFNKLIYIYIYIYICSYRLVPFKLGQPFTLEVLIDERETLWAIDGEHYCNYMHRNPSPLTASWVQITGVRDATLNIQHTNIYPILSSSVSEVINYVNLFCDQFDNNSC